ncbi:ras-responsive element-binding protein 1 isoform X2 [Syngnathoides biaculeatus]|nr:ras-responsive element-binding protein 1 isoform X2 [Syngnathoides biaculeatus]
MDNCTEKQEGGGANAAPNGEEAEPTPPSSIKAAPDATKNADESRQSVRGGDGGGGGDLSSINAMMSAVMAAAGNLNGEGDAPSDATPAGSPSPSLNKTPASSATRAPPARNVRRSQDAKDDHAAHVCPLCDKSCQSQHQLTMHIRQHNADAGATDHSCSICGKCLSSASSLDRHMLVHSGERPYKCSVCAQTFTTNGNMHRHMKIHEKDPASGLLPVSPPSPTKRRRPSAKRRQDPEDEGAEEPPAKKVTDDSPSEESAAAPTTPSVLSAGARAGDELALPCPICFKTCGGRLELDAHMDTHPDTTLKCDLCCLSFRTHRGLLRHNAAVHKLLPRDPSGQPFIQTNPSIPAGFNDLSFVDFSCKKFARVAQVWCETNLRRCVGKFHRFVCESCDKAFPLRPALDLHKSAAHPADGGAEEAHDAPPRGGDRSEDAPLYPQSDFMEALGLRHVSKVTRTPTEDEIHQAHLDSIKVIHVEPLSCSLPQEPAFLTAPGVPLLERSAAVAASTLQGLSQRDALSLLTLQPFQAGFLLQPDGAAAVKTGEAGGVVELADIQQILKVAAAAPNQMGLGFAAGQGQVQNQKAMPPLKPKPPATPRSSLTPTTPPPLQSSQQASLGCIGPGPPPPPPPASALFKTPSSSSSAETRRPPTDSPPAAATAAHEEAGLGGKKAGMKAPGVADAGSAKGAFSCRFCDQVFSFSGVLHAHMRFHLGILPHQCNICDYVAPDKATLIRHLRTHSGERPYICRVCHYPFTVKANCERHLRKKHGKTSRKDIEKHIKCVFSASPYNPSGTADTETGRGGAETVCRFCGEDLKTYRALQIHLRTHNGCQRKPFECRRCGAAFLAKRNCIHHLLKQHPEVQEREIEEHIASVRPAEAPARTRDATPYHRELDQPLDFSAKGRGAHAAIKAESVSPSSACPPPDQPVDLSVPSKRLRRAEADGCRMETRQNCGVPADEDKGAAASPPGGGRFPPGPSPAPLLRPQRLKPLLPKPASLKELPPLASIAQIIHSVSAAPDLLKRDVASDSPSELPGGSATPETPGDDSVRKRNRKKSAKDALVLSGAGVLDLESSGEFASVEKMLANTDANKFTNFLQTGADELPPKTAPGDGERADEEAGPREDAKTTTAAALPQSKGKKNAYSNSVQKMTCPFCPRVFPWASSLQRHMLTHTGQKPFPCPRCDAFFSTKSNCERHLLRKHGVTNRTLRRNGVFAKKGSDDGSHESAESQSDAEPPANDGSPPGHAPPGAVKETSPERRREEPASRSPAHKPSSAGSSPVPACELEYQQGAAENSTDAAKESPPGAKGDHDDDDDDGGDEDDDDCHSNKSLDLNFGSKLIDFKLSNSTPGPGPAPQEEASAALAADAPEAPSTGLAAKPQADWKHVCGVCRKSFRYATTLARHERAHLGQETPPDAKEASAAPAWDAKEERAEEEPEPKDDDKDEAARAGDSDGAESGGGGGGGGGDDDDDGDNKDDERSDGEVSSEAKSLEGADSANAVGAAVDKRKKKTCAVCAKRFWSLQDLTRHMRSHTGERPYRCATCERTFTLKHSLVRHQRIHANKTPSEDGDAHTPTETCPPSENESECAKDLDDAPPSDPEQTQTPPAAASEETPELGAAPPETNHPRRSVADAEMSSGATDTSAAPNPDVSRELPAGGL